MIIQHNNIESYNIINKLVILLGKCINLIKLDICDEIETFSNRDRDLQINLIKICLDCIDEFLQVHIHMTVYLY